MKKLKNKILSIILSVAMMTTFLPIGTINAVFASDFVDVSTTGLDLSGGEVPLVETIYKAGEGSIVWSPTTTTIAGTGEEILSGGTIILKNATIVATGDGITLPTLFENGTVDISIELEGSNTIKTPYGHGITFNASIGSMCKSLIISEHSLGGSLSIESKYAGIYLQNPITVQSGTLNIKTKESMGIGTQNPNNHININGGNINIDANENAIQAFVSDVNITGGNLTLSGQKSIRAGGKVTLSGDAKIDTTNNITIVGGVPNSLSDIFTKADTVTGTVNNVKVESISSFNGEVLKTFNMDGTIYTPKVTIDGVEYSVYDDVTNKGIDLAEEAEPPFPIAFKAGEGYVIYNPITATLTLNNAIIDNNQPQPLINLPLKDVTIKLVGDNFLVNSTNDGTITSLIKQGGSYDFEGTPEKQTPKDYSITVTGTGTLCAISRYATSISTRGTFVMESGTIRNDSGMRAPRLNVTGFDMRGGSIILSQLNSFSDASITGGSILSTDFIQIVGDLTMSGGNVKCSSDYESGIGVLGTVKKTGGTLNGLVMFVELIGKTPNLTITMFDDVIAGRYNDEGILIESPRMMVGEVKSSGGSGNFLLNIPTGKTLTFPVGSIFDIEIAEGKSLSNYVTNNGKFINNGMILLHANATKEEVMDVVKVLKPTGTGMIVVGHDEKMYSNSGEELNILPDDLDLSNKTPATGTDNSYTFTGDDTSGYTLTLNSLALFGQLTLPSNVPVTIQTNSVSIIDGGISFAGGYAGNLTFTGTAPLAVNSDISGSTNGDVVNVLNGANVTINGRISIGASGGADGTLNVDGKGTTLNVVSPDSCAVYCDTINVRNGANMIANAFSRGVNVLDGGVTVTNGSTLTTNCDYGVYIIGGKLTVDETSKLITHGAIAPFCIIDKTNTKTQNEVVSLPALPTGTSIASVVGTDIGYGYTYWSLVPTGGSLAVTDENSEPVTLTGAMKGLLTFAKAAPVNPGNGVNVGGTTTNTPEKPITPVKPQPTIPKPKPTIPKTNPQTGDSIPTALPIMSILGLILLALGLRLKKTESQS